jgi:hypothetical protein
MRAGEGAAMMHAAKERIIYEEYMVGFITDLREIKKFRE